MTGYRLTFDFTAEDLITWDYNISDPAEFFKTAIEDIDPEKIKSFRLEQLDANGRPVKQPKCFTLGQQ